MVHAVEREKHQQSTKNNKKEEVGSLMTTPELEDDNLNEVGALNEKVSKVLTFDETDASLVETPMTCDSVQSSSASLLPADKKNKYNETVATKQKRAKKKTVIKQSLRRRLLSELHLKNGCPRRGKVGSSKRDLPLLLLRRRMLKSTVAAPLPPQLRLHRAKITTTRNIK